MRILLADDHHMFRSGLRRILEDDFPDAIIAEAASCDETLAQVARQRMDLLILDIAMGKENSLHILPAIRDACPDLPVLLLSMYDDKQFIVQALRAGVSGYLTKEHAPEELIRAIRTILGGRRYVSASVAAHLADYLAVGSSEFPHQTLSAREHEVFLRIAAGQSVSDIAKELCLSVKTISTYRTRILEKMDVGSNAELMRYAMQHGLVT
ncbi:response regulator [Kordiimonas lipolytica]|uniref:Response regulator n=1 Tax=Kordiimonas lipolytica TaxID=1662421 RepID=A0ABV8U801_9PROT|nr:response regulator transcription factor [Kordiimonas lipolytica]